jgi:hypothetical protein
MINLGKEIPGKKSSGEIWKGSFHVDAKTQQMHQPVLTLGSPARGFIPFLLGRGHFWAHYTRTTHVGDLEISERGLETDAAEGMRVEIRAAVLFMHSPSSLSNSLSHSPPSNAL